MPIYDFICRACKKKFEILVMGSTKPRCPKCQSTDLAKQMSTFAHKRGSSSAAGGGSGSGCGSCSSSNCKTCH